MHIEDVKKKYGNRASSKGNVDCLEILTFGIVDQVINKTKQCIHYGAYDYILSSSNGIHSGVKPKNCVDIIDGLDEFEHYPLIIYF